MGKKFKTRALSFLFNHFKVHFIIAFIQPECPYHKQHFFWKFHRNSSSSSVDMKIFSFNINYIHWFFGICDLPCLKETNDATCNGRCQHFFYFQDTLKRLFDNFTRLYWYWINFFLKYEGVGVKLAPPKKKLPSKSPALGLILFLRLSLMRSNIWNFSCPC